MSEPVTFEVQVDPLVSAIRADPQVTTVRSDEGPVALVLAVPGQQGTPGPPGAGVMVYGGTLVGDKDGVNSTYTTQFAFQANTVSVYVNGLREFHVVATPPDTVVFEDPPSVDDNIRIDYLRS